MSETTSTPATEQGAANPEAETGGEIATPAKVDNATAAELRRERKAHKAAQQQLTELQAKLDLADREKLDELERTKLERDEYKSKFEESNSNLLTTKKRSAFDRLATRAGAKNLETAWKLADPSAIELNEDGSVTGASDQIKALVKEHDYLFGAPPATAGSGGGNPSSGSPKITSKDINKMSDEEYRKHRASFG